MQVRCRSTDGYYELIILDKGATGECLRGALAKRVRRAGPITADMIVITSNRGQVFSNDLIRENWRYVFEVKTPQDYFQEFCYGLGARTYFSNKVDRLEEYANKNESHYRDVYDEALRELVSLVDWPKRYRVLLRGSRLRLENLLKKTQISLVLVSESLNSEFLDIIFCKENTEMIEAKISGLENFLMENATLSNSIHFQAMYLASYLTRWPSERAIGFKQRLNALICTTMTNVARLN